MIVKVQLPIVYAAEPMALVYNEDRSVQVLVPVTQELVHKLHGELKGFFHAKQINGSPQLVIEEPAEWQSW